MRISAKGRYALCAAVDMAVRYDSGSYITVVSISERFGISKIYLEQVFSLLKRGGLVYSVKGAQGGYQLARRPEHINLFDLLSAVEMPLFEAAGETVADSMPELENALRSLVYQPLDDGVRRLLTQVTLADLVTQTQQSRDGLQMFYI